MTHGNITVRIYGDGMVQITVRVDPAVFGQIPEPDAAVELCEAVEGVLQGWRRRETTRDPAGSG